MYEKLETIGDLKQKIENLFIRQKRKLTQFEIVNLFKRAGVDRVYQALDEMVRDNKLITDDDPIAPQSYQLVINVS